MASVTDYMVELKTPFAVVSSHANDIFCCFYTEDWKNHFGCVVIRGRWLWITSYHKGWFFIEENKHCSSHQLIFLETLIIKLYQSYS